MLLDLKVSKRKERLFLELTKSVRANFKAGQKLKIKVLNGSK